MNLVKVKKRAFSKKTAIGSLSLAFIIYAFLLIPLIWPYFVQRNNGFRNYLSVPSFSQKQNSQKESKKEPEIKNFWLTIEKLDLKNAKVIREVSADNKSEYEKATKEGLAHARGTAFPGDGKMVYIFGHNTNYPWLVDDINALFFRLETVAEGDMIKVEYNGKPYTYRVFETRIIKADDTDHINKISNDDVLVLQTCYPPGTWWKRLLVFAKPIYTNSEFGNLI